MDLSFILSILANLVGIFSPFILDFINAKRANNGAVNIEGDVTLNIYNSTLSGGERLTASNRKREITRALFNFVNDSSSRFRLSINIIIIASIMLSLFNILIYTFLDVRLFGWYIELILNRSYFNINLGYFLIFATLATLYFSILMMINFYRYDRCLYSLLKNNESWVDLGELSYRKLNDSKLLLMLYYPSKTISRIIENKLIATKNKTKKTKGDLRLFSEVSFINKYKYFLKPPFFFILIANVIFILFFSTNINKPHYLSRINIESLSYLNGDIVTDKDRLTLLPEQIIRNGGVFFDAIKESGTRYSLSVDQIETVEPRSRFTRKGYINKDTQWRFSPFGPQGSTINLIDTPLFIGQSVRVHKYDGEWTLVLTDDNQQGFVYQNFLEIY